MEAELTPDQEALARCAEFQASLERSRAPLARGEGREITPESMRQLSAEVRERGSARLIADLANDRSWRRVGRQG